MLSDAKRRKMDNTAASMPPPQTTPPRFDPVFLENLRAENAATAVRIEAATRARAQAAAERVVKEKSYNPTN